MPDHDYIPSGILEFNSWQNNFVDKVNIHKSGWNWDADTKAEWKLLTATTGIKKKKFDAAFKAYNGGNCKSSVKVALRTARREYENGLRFDPNDTSLRIFIGRYIRNNPKVEIQQKKEMGLPAPKTGSSAFTDASSDIDTELAVRITQYGHLKHVLAVSSPGRKSKAKGKKILEIDIFICLTDAKITESPAMDEYKYDGVVERGLYVRIFKHEEEGMRAWYIARRKGKGREKKYGKPSMPENGLIP